MVALPPFTRQMAIGPLEIRCSKGLGATALEHFGVKSLQQGGRGGSPKNKLLHQQCWKSGTKMNELASAVILGLVEGLTEFLPISSTGHLILAGALMNLDGPGIATVEISMQIGAILAVVVLYWSRFRGLLAPTARQKFSGIYGLWLLFLTCLPAGMLGLAAHSRIKEFLFKPLPVALALVAGAVLMLFIERKRPPARYADLDAITPKLALGIGFCQCFSLWPGFSRSASSIMGGMLLGVDRQTAADYSFIAAVPLIFAASFFELCKSWSTLGQSDWLFLGVGLAVSFISAMAAIKVFIRLLGRLGLAPFAWYRLALAPLVYWFFM